MICHYGKRQQRVSCVLSKNVRDSSKYCGTVSFSFRCTCVVLASERHLLEDIPDDRIEGIWRQLIDVFRGGILADWYVYLIDRVGNFV